MSSLFSGIFDLVGGDPASQQEKDLEGLSGYETKTGEGLIDPASKFYEDILSGDPAKIAEALAPEIKSGAEAVAQQAKTTNEFGNRSGGNTASNNAAQAGERGNIISLIGDMQTHAADAAGSLGSNLVGQASGNINDTANLKINRRNQVNNDVGGIAKGAAEIAMPFLGGGAGAAGDPYETLYNAHQSSGLETTPSDLTEMIQ